MKCKRNDTVNRSFGRTKRRAAEREKKAMPGGYWGFNNYDCYFVLLPFFIPCSISLSIVYTRHHTNPQASYLSLSHPCAAVAAASPAGTSVGRMRRRFLSGPPPLLEVEASEQDETVAGRPAW